MTEVRAGAPLYSTDLLALAVSLADYPIDPELPLQGEVRSRTCGSSVVCGFEIAQSGAVARFAG